MPVRSARSASWALALGWRLTVSYSPGVEPARLEQHGARHDDLADVVQQAGERRLRDAAAVEPGRVGQLDRDARDSRRMLGVGGDLRVEPASQLEQAREVDALSHGPQTDD